MPAATYDQITLQSILQNLPEFQRRQQQVERLRNARGQFQAIGQKTGNPNYTRTTTGGLGYQTVGRYIPDYAGMTNEAIGAIGSAWTGRNLEKSEAELNNLRNEQIIKAAEQVSRPSKDADDGSPSQAALRAYLGILGGPDVSSIMGSQVRVASTKVDQDGKVWNIMSNGQVVPAGITADYSSQVLQVPGQEPVLVGRSGAGRGVARQVTFGPGSESQPAPQAQQQAPAVGGNIDREDLHERMRKAESNNDPNAVSPKGARGLMQLMPGTARELEAALGMPPGSTDSNPEANEKAGRVYMDQLLQKYRGDQSLALAAYNWGPGNVDRWIADGADPAKVPQETQSYVKGILSGRDQTPNIAQTAAANAGSPSLRTPTKFEEALDAARAKNVAEAEGATAAAQAAGLKKGFEVDAETAAKARAALPGIQSSSAQAMDVIRQLKSARGLGQIVGGLGGRIPENKVAQGIFNAVMAGTPAADAMALHQQIRGGVFLRAYETLKGGGQITEVEGQKAEAAMGRLERAQTKEAYLQALGELEQVIIGGVARAQAAAAGGQAPAPAPVAPTQPAGLPAGWKVRVKGG